MKKRNGGVAAITAILIVAVAASAATLMLAQQAAMLDQTTLVGSRAQAEQYATAGLDWARGVLAQDAATSTVDTLDEAWARPIAGLPVERALVAGSIADEQGKFNLNNLVNATQRSETDVKLLRHLLSTLDLSPDLADAVLDWIDPDSDLTSSAGAEDAYYLALPRPYRAANAKLMQVDELYRVRGFDARTVARLRPYVTALDERTTINVNTASDVVVAAMFGIGRERAQQLLSERRVKPFANIAAFEDRLRQAGLIGLGNFDVKSRWFAVGVQVSQDDVTLGLEALVRREPAGRGTPVIIWRRPRF